MSANSSATKRGTEEPAEAAETKKPKISISFGAKPAAAPAKAEPNKAISISFGQKPAQPAATAAVPSKPKTAPAPTSAAALLDDDDEEEEMPQEARMRMRNVGKQTPTSAGPNSFNKGAVGFTDNSKRWVKSVEKLAEEAGIDLATKKPPEPKVKVDNFKKALEKNEELE